jgi:hypothetical protein
MICGSGTVSVCAQTKHERKEKEKEEALVKLEEALQTHHPRKKET